MALEEWEKEKKMNSDDESRSNDDEKPHTAAGLEEPNPDAVAPAEYPQGMKLGMIMFALIMAIFLMSLDMVR